jgi:hypothetical protein
VNKQAQDKQRAPVGVIGFTCIEGAENQPEQVRTTDK